MSSQHPCHSCLSGVQIRLATLSDADYAARYAVLHACDPATTLEKLKYSDTVWDAKYQQKHFLVEVDGVAVATGTYAEWIWWYESGRYVLYLCVHPAFRRQGHGAALYDAMREHLASETPPGRTFMCKCRENEPESVRFITQRGFQQTGRDLFSELDVTTFDAARFALSSRRMREQGIEIVSYPELGANDPDFHRKLYDLTCLSMQDMPAGGTRTYQPFETFVRSVFEYPGFLAEIFFVAVDKGRYVGQSDLVDEKQDREHLGTGYTGVHPDYRRRGIATALKVRCIQAAKELGVKTISTGNDQSNPMYQLNLQLGFRPMAGELLFEMKVA